MDALIKMGYFDLALSVYEDFKDDDLVEERRVWKEMKSDTVEPDVIAYTTIINEFDGFRVMLIELTRHTNSESFNPIVVSYAEMKKMDEFYELLVQMKKLGSSVMDDLAEFWQWKCLRT
ncbi:hypothetical protein G4B88_030887 [Cannabis sativa]|uniref:Pentatricopeptide repeat-containing protein n=1 Tax=Cannabis sativa TaxID=3483 RepID=A0A7J6DY19_CANSA|nr:hypothetical protein G4B88_030887 [Cannabis sativa]